MTKDEIKFRKRLRDELPNLTKCKDENTLRLSASGLLESSQWLEARGVIEIEFALAVVAGAGLLVAFVTLLVCVAETRSYTHLQAAGIGLVVSLTVLLFALRSFIALPLRKRRYKQAIIKAVKESNFPSVVKDLEVAL